MSTEKPNLLIGAILATLCYLCVALMTSCSKAASATVATLTIVFFQNWISLIINLYFSLKNGMKGLKTHHPFLLLTRCITGIFSFYLLFLSIEYIPLANGVLLQNTAPLWIPFIIWIWCKKKVPKHLWWSLIIGFIGIVFILKPGPSIFDFGDIIGLASGMLLAISLFAIKRLTDTEPMPRVLFYYFLLGALLSGPFAVKELGLAFSFPVIFYLLGVGIFFYLAQICIYFAFNHGKASTLSPFCYTAVLFSALLDWFFWNNIPDWYSLIGMMLVIIGGIFAVVLEQKYEKKFI